MMLQSNSTIQEMCWCDQLYKKWPAVSTVLVSIRHRKCILICLRKRHFERLCYPPSCNRLLHFPKSFA